jgi:hypothetical protein
LVIRFLNAKNVRPAEIHRHIVEVYGEGAMKAGSVREWCRLFVIRFNTTDVTTERFIPLPWYCNFTWHHLRFTVKFRMENRINVTKYCPNVSLFL